MNESLLLGPPHVRRRLAALSDRPLNFDPASLEHASPATGWTITDVCQALPAEPPGAPIDGGSWQIARRLMRGYEFADPSIVRTYYDPETPLEGRSMLLKLQTLRMVHLYVGVRVGDVYEEAREFAGERACVWGWNYRTIEGHVEMGQMDWEVWKWLGDGRVEFRVHAMSRVAHIRNPVVRVGFHLMRERERRAFLESTKQRMLAFTKLALSREHAGDSIRDAAASLTARPDRGHDPAHDSLRGAPSEVEPTPCRNAFPSSSFRTRRLSWRAWPAPPPGWPAAAYRPSRCWFPASPYSSGRPRKWSVAPTGSAACWVSAAEAKSSPDCLSGHARAVAEHPCRNRLGARSPARQLDAAGLGPGRSGSTKAGGAGDGGGESMPIAQKLDHAQKRSKVPSIAVATWKKFQEDRSTNLASMIAFWAFFSIFPLFLVLVTVMAWLLSSADRSAVLGHVAKMLPLLDPSTVNGLTGAWWAFVIGLFTAALERHRSGPGRAVRL